MLKIAYICKCFSFVLLFGNLMRFRISANFDTTADSVQFLLVQKLCGI